ncbi:unnamed protein product, partial [Meganyctiphanes norvegica]
GNLLCVRLFNKHRKMNNQENSSSREPILDLTGSNLYNRRKNNTGPEELLDESPIQSRSLPPIPTDIVSVEPHNLRQRPLLAQDSVDAVYDSIDSPNGEKRMTLMSESELQHEYRKKYLENLDLEAASNDRPPSFSPPDVSLENKDQLLGTNNDNKDSLHIMSLGSMTCTRCNEGFEPQEKIVNSNGQLWHTQCFVCAQCFQPFPDDIFYEFEGRKYCEHDFQVLFAPCCGKCNEFIIGRVIKAMNFNWHPQCFTCNLCSKELADLGFIRNAGRALCHECNARVKAESEGKYMCHKCHSTIDGQPLRWRGDTYHPYHFNCSSCANELTSDAREIKSRPGYTANDMNELYCLRCHDKMGIPICGACRRPIEERVVTALGKHWHVEHFVCGKCEKPFMGNRHYERKGMAYCETHYHELFGNLCFICNQVIYGDVVTALNKAWCTHHFACATCDQKMTQKTKFFEFDQKPICKKCYEKFPQELKKRLKKQHEVQARGGKPLN